MKKLFLSLLLIITPVAHAWEKIAPNTYVGYGTKISKDRIDSKAFAELAYNKNTDTFKINFISRDGIRDTVSYGMYNIWVCGTSTTGAIVGDNITSSEYTDLHKVFIDCKRPAFFRLWNLQNEHTTYKFENLGPIMELDNEEKQ